MKGKTLEVLAISVCFAVLIAAIAISILTPQVPTEFPPSPTEFNPKTAMASFYEPVEFSIQPSLAQYSLPLDLETTINFNQINSRFDLNELQRDRLSANGFVIIPFGRENDMVEVYETIKGLDIPIFITSDTLLHLYHIQFNEILKYLEENEFFGQIEEMSEEMLNDSLEKYNSLSGDLKEAARRNVAYFTVALKLLNPSATIPGVVEDEVNQELQLIDEHRGFSNSQIFKYREDYSQYVPRGHYTRSETLERYFKGMMWYGRMAFLMKGSPDTISEEDARTQTIQASLIASSMGEVSVGIKSVDNLWGRIYSVTSFFVGTADDLTPYEYKDAIMEVFGATFEANELSDEEKLLELKVVLACLRSPQIYGGTGEIYLVPPITPEKLNEVLDKTKGMRFMGQRYVPDSYMFQHLVFPEVMDYTGDGEPFTLTVTGTGWRTRGFPRGLDVMAVLGSERALEILEEEGDTEYENYYDRLENLRAQFAEFDENDWNRNLYWSWLYALRPLLAENWKGYPTFMQTQAWLDKELNTALASWTELRHDTILYAKQSYTPGMAALPQPPGYVEPVPEFYARVLALTRMTREGLAGLDALDEVSEGRLQHLEGILERLLDISIRELENQELTEEDYNFIRNFGEMLEPTLEEVESEGKETTLVADVHTDINSYQVLEEGVGYVDLILVAYEVPDGSLVVGAGPVFSYYEFKHPIDDRLTDEAWVELLGSNPPERQGWAESFFVPS